MSVCSCPLGSVCRCAGPAPPPVYSRQAHRELPHLMTRIAELEAENGRLNGVVTGLRCGYRDLRALAQWIADGYDKHRFPNAVARLVLRVYPDTPPSEEECQRLLAMRHQAHTE